MGIGASLYLLTLKAFAWFFLFLTLLNTPIFVILLSGTENGQQLGGLFGYFTLGNIGEEGPTCQTWDFSKNKTMLELKCRTGKMRKLLGVGLTKERGK